MVVADELDGCGRSLPIFGEALEVFEDRKNAGGEKATASSVYLSKSVSKMP